MRAGTVLYYYVPDQCLAEDKPLTESRERSKILVCMFLVKRSFMI